VNYDGKSFADDGVQLERDVYYKQLPTIRPVPKTAAPPPSIVEPIIETALSNADHVVAVCLSAKLSGVYNAFRLAVSKFDSSKITLIDSGQVAMGLGWQVLIAAELAESTGDVEAIKQALQRVSQNQRLYAALDTLEYLKHSGRVSWASAGIGALLQIKPILDVQEGEVKSHSRVRTFKRAFDELNTLAREQAPLDRLAIMHAANHSGAEELHNALKDIAPPDTLIVNIAPAIGTHIGPGGLGIATVSKSWRT
jgi:DegV family protein with EDD domain